MMTIPTKHKLSYADKISNNTSQKNSLIYVSLKHTGIHTDYYHASNEREMPAPDLTPDAEIYGVVPGQGGILMSVNHAQ